MNIVIVGGGAGGLELATRLGRKFGRRKKANITLIDRNNTHLWKPLLHEVASGSLDMGVDSLSYRAHAYNHHFRFKLGSLSGIDRNTKTITLASLTDEEDQEVLPERKVDYDILVLALGSVTNDFGTPGVKEHALFLDAATQAEKFHTKLLNGLLKLNKNAEQDKSAVYRIAIVGAGATGVELSAELHHTFNTMKAYGLNELKPSQLKISLIEAGPRILPALPERISASAHKELGELGVDVKTNTLVARGEAGAFITKDDQAIEADLLVWAAGIKVPDQFAAMSDLETNRINQWQVKPTLQTTLDNNIYALGDCAACIMPDGKQVPPRAQSAHQMASHVYLNIARQLKGEPADKEYQYTDYGSLVNLSRYSTVGSLMGNLSKGSMMIEGRIARLMYVSLYRLHQLALHGWVRTGLRMVSDRINKIIRPRLKLH
ncbi:NAD(P)/FAD-dependent oxidoreductase [Reinekea marina]|uniref:NAD(P)/FAD-dependent oxidoreductase n=1 Tax=Reinekea marina TaxID=1310421 RepID=A0ABV7WUZ1_9GAMM|nr:NAD(P)/FAD-dependent oxidoreductase [Reinekea marina]MDN3647536.1 NAD(P)/FAD-dependent oxidoreductase [Reinekea marina]MDN3651105.1 NAD(P)/FAD-dependent oxidoreductase [Reinekea marina]